MCSSLEVFTLQPPPSLFISEVKTVSFIKAVDFRSQISSRDLTICTTHNTICPSIWIKEKGQKERKKKKQLQHNNLNWSFHLKSSRWRINNKDFLPLLRCQRAALFATCCSGLHSLQNCQRGFNSPSIWRHEWANAPPAPFSLGRQCIRCSQDARSLITAVCLPFSEDHYVPPRSLNSTVLQA